MYIIVPFFFTKWNEQISNTYQYFVVIFNKKIIYSMLIGYEMIMANVHWFSWRKLTISIINSFPCWTSKVSGVTQVSFGWACYHMALSFNFDLSSWDLNCASLSFRIVNFLLTEPFLSIPHQVVVVFFASFTPLEPATYQ